MPSDAAIEGVRQRLPDQAHKEMFDGALAALATNNPQRAQHFAVTMRELFGHLLSSQASNEDVTECVWYEQEEGTQGPTRRQRALYLSRGGLSDEFIRDKLQLDPDEFHQGIGKAFKELSEYTHVRPDKAPTQPAQIEEFAERTLDCFNEVFDTVGDVRREIEGSIEPHLQNEAASAFIRETIDELDILGGRYSTEGVLFDDVQVTKIGPEVIEYRVAGTVDVSLEYGSKSDSAEIDENFPFACRIVAKASDPFTFLEDKTEMTVDTSSWQQ